MFVITTELVEALIVFQDLKAPIGLLKRGSMFETGRATMTSPTVLYICMYIIVRIYIYIYMRYFLIQIQSKIACCEK